MTKISDQLGFSLDLTVGASFLSTVICASLWGLTGLQVWFYYDNYRGDRLWLKTMVAFVFFCDTAHQVSITYGAYDTVVTHFGEYFNLFSIGKSLYIEALLTGMTGFLVKTFFCWRIWQFKKSYLLMAGIYSLVLAELAATLVFAGVGLARDKNTVLEVMSFQALTVSVMALGAASDIAITSSICIFLRERKTGFAWSNALINRLMFFSISSGLVTALCAIASLVLLTTLYDFSFMFVFFYYIMGRFYAISLLATLNARQRISDATTIGSVTESTQNLPSPFMLSPSPRRLAFAGGKTNSSSFGNMNPGGIHVSMHTILESDTSTNSPAGSWLDLEKAQDATMRHPSRPSLDSNKSHTLRPSQDSVVPPVPHRPRKISSPRIPVHRMY